MAEHNIETTEFKVTHSVDGDGVGTATIEATREDFVSYRSQVTDKEVATVTEGMFQKTSAFVKNAKMLLCESKESPVLTVKKSFEKEGLVLIFSAEFLEASFTLVLLEVETSALELLAKRVERLESRPPKVEYRGESGSRSTLPKLVYEASSKDFRTTWNEDMRGYRSLDRWGQKESSEIEGVWQRTFILQEHIKHFDKGPIIQQSGRYQIFLSNHNLCELCLVIDGRQVASGGQHLIFVSNISKGQQVTVSKFGKEAKPTCKMTIMRWD